MSPTDITILALLIAGLIFSIIELGLSAYEVSYWDTYYYGSPSGFISFLLFASLWTLLRTGFRLVRQLLRTQSPVDASGRPAAWIPILTLVINAVTMIFWLAGFAAYASLLQGLIVVGEAGALLAFAIMLWLVFLALLALNILTACGVLRSDIVDYAALRKGNSSTWGGGSKQERGAVPHGPVPASEVQ